MIYKNLEANRLTLKCISQDDREFIYRHFSDDCVNEFLFDAEPIQTMEQADEIIRFYTDPVPAFWHRWIIIRKEDGVKIGTCGFHRWDQNKDTVEIGYDMSPEYWGKGYAIEAVGRLIEFTKDVLGVKKVHAHIYIQNDRSVNLVKHLGFKPTGKKNEIFRGKPYLHHIYTLEL
ncbi:MAG TPA: N-acetyltransferase [Clostridiales bacterium]|nr:N-acetyltransferase [Clostridiales bacterium]